MLKTVSSITNAIGALNFKGTWNASTNTPTIVSGVGVKGDYFVVSVAGSTTIDGISNWGVGDWITYNGTVWQRVEGGADLNGVNLSVSGTTTLSNLTASTALALNASKEIVSVTNTGTGDNVLATAPTLVGDVTLSTGNLVVSNGKGIDFSATSHPAGMTSELLADYEEGTWTPTVAGNTTAGTHTYTTQVGRYTKVGDTVYVQISIVINAMGTGGNAGAGYTTIAGLPFTPGGSDQIGFSIGWLALVTFSNTPSCYGVGGSTSLTLRELETATYGSTISIANVADGAYISVAGSYKV